MGDNSDKTPERIPMDLAPAPLLKVLEPPRNSSGTALLRTVPLPAQQARFLTTNIQSSASTQSVSSSPINKQGSVQRLIESTPTVSGMASTAVINRLTAVPVQGSTISSYHVPIGPAAVANIAVPRPSVATPIIRGTSTLQTITPVSQSGLVRGVSTVGVRGSSPWLGVATSQPPRHPHNNAFVQSQSRMAVSTRIGPGTTVSTRPVLLQATAPQPQKQLQPATQQVHHVTEKKFIQKGVVSNMRSTTFTSSTPPQARLAVGQPLSRLNPPLRPVVSLHPTTMLVSTPTTIQLQPGTPAVSTRPVSVLTSAVRVTSAPGAGVAVSKVYCQTNEPSVFIQTTHKPAQTSNVVNIANSIYSLPANSFYENSNNLRTFATTPVTTTTSVPVRQTPNTQGLVSSGQAMRFNPVMVVEQNVHPYVPNESAQSMQSTESCPNTSVQHTHIKQNASPRPSILRKRDTEGTPGKAAKNLNPLFSTLTVSTPSSPPSPPKRPESRGNGGAPSSGGSTTISATSSPGLAVDSPPPSIKQEPVEEDRPLEMSPRKKPRKQQLTGNEIQEPKFCDEEIEFQPSEKIKKTAKESVSLAVKPLPRRPVMSLLRTCRPSWKPKQNHFLRYSDVKPREEKRPTISDIASQRNVLQKVNGWKIYHLSAQMANISDLETDVLAKLTAMLKALEKKSGKDGDINRVNELIKGNIQRSKVIVDQVQEAKCQVMKLFDHKCQVTELINRFTSRRMCKKRERV